MAIMKKCLVVLLVLFSLSFLAYATTVSHDGRALVINGQRKIIISGSIHYPRSTPEMWPELIQKAKEGGLDAIETYVFWNAHEPVKRQYNFEGNLDLVRFLKEVQNAGLYAILRIGPYVCAEWDYGGFPAWLRQIPGMELRTNNQQFKDEMQTFTTLIIDMIKKENLMAPQGGPIILSQIENEYGNIDSAYGSAAKKYIQWCANLAQSLDIGVPWIMCQQSDAPQPMINTCNGFYCHDFQPNNANSPKIWTENWTGWFKDWNQPDPHRPAENLAYSVARFFQLNGTVQNYYMYHGGTNFGRSSGGPYITTTYDYDAPLDEYGNIRQPKWGHLKELHEVLKSMEHALVYGNFNSKQVGNGSVYITEYTGEGITPGCFISNSDTSVDAIVEYKGNNYSVPAASVSILPQCKEEVYNTAKVNSQTSIMVKKRNQAEDEPEELSWSWRAEALNKRLKGSEGTFTDYKLLDQILANGDTSDYLWYMTTHDHDDRDMDMTLHVTTQGHVLHAFVNGEHVGSKYAPNGQFSFTLDADVKIKQGINYISLLSGTVGHTNYGARFELIPTGIAGGPVVITGDNVTHDLSTQLWAYKVGLDGEDNEIYMDKPHHNWNTEFIPTMRPFTWYKTTFKAPLGDEPVVVNLEGMGKGMAWVNGNSLGRYWPSTIANDQGCQQCDYRLAYNPDNNCRSGCGEPAQIWYHVPRSFLKEGEPNTLILFEEAGGEPYKVNFQTVTVGTVCGRVEEGKTLTLSCQGGRTISDIEFASFGDAAGKCGSFQKGTCDSKTALGAIQKECVGKMTCSIEGSAAVLGDSGCKNRPVSLAVQAVCS